MLLNTAGRLTRLRVHDRGTRFGPQGDQLDVEVVVWLDTEPGRAFGLRLRNDAQRPAHAGMLDLLRDGFNHGFTVNLDYEVDAGKENGTILRVWLTR